MQASLPEEVGQTSRELISVFQSAPMLLAVLLFNVMFMAMIAWMVHTGSERWQHALDNALRVCQGYNLGGVEIPKQ